VLGVCGLPAQPYCENVKIAAMTSRLTRSPDRQVEPLHGVSPRICALAGVERGAEPVAIRREERLLGPTAAGSPRSLANDGPPTAQIPTYRRKYRTAGVDMRSQNPRLCRHFVGTRLPRLAIRVGEVPSSNLGARSKSPAFAGFFVRGKVPWRAFRFGSEWAVRAVHCQNAHLSVGGIGMVAWLSAHDPPRKLR
jgi:hypothetical protein